MIIDPNGWPSREEMYPPPTPGPRHRFRRALMTVVIIIGALVAAVALVALLEALGLGPYES
jgi:hypothetical protein